MTPEQSSEFLQKIKTADGEKQIAAGLSFEVLMGELFRRLNATEKNEAEIIGNLLRKSVHECSRMKLQPWVQQNIVLWHSLVGRFLDRKQHVNGLSQKTDS